VLADFLLELRRQRRLDHPLANPGAALREGLHVLDLERFELGGDAVGQPLVAQELAESEGGGGKAAGHTYIRGGKLADHLTQRSVLAADRLDVGHAQLFEGNDVASFVTVHGKILTG